MSIRILSSELQKKSCNELNEVPKRIPEDLKHIRDWIAKQPHLISRTDDQWILSFLRGCKFSLQRTKEKLDRYYTIRSLMPEYFLNRDPFFPEMQLALEAGLCLPLPIPANYTGPRIIVIKCESVDPNKIHFTTAVKLGLMIMDILLNEDDNFTISGQMGLLNNKGMTHQHALQVTPTAIKKLVTCLQDAYPVRPRGVHIINSSYIIETIFNIAKPFIKSKIADRIHFYSNDKKLSKIYEDIPYSILPKDYGGEGPSLRELTVEWKKKVESYRDWFLKDYGYYSDEEKRVENPKTTECIFGIQGSFRKLDID